MRSTNFNSIKAAHFIELIQFPSSSALSASREKNNPAKLRRIEQLKSGKLIKSNDVRIEEKQNKEIESYPSLLFVCTDYPKREKGRDKLFISI